MKKLAFTAFIALTACVMQGCDDGTNVETVPAAGIVSMAGKPLEGVSVSLLPISDVGIKGAYGVSDSSGNVTIQVSPDQEGIPPGEYGVILQQFTQPDGSPIPEGSSAADVGAVNQIHPLYGNTDNFLIKVTVPPEGDSNLKFDMVKNPR
ncbi:hypothetical protein FF011L_14070 [Roseimaritima multifibrata]|uniref:Uncharacterized protein n=1 Tax=Roseimaritima multifibrata TaxID=1930274 RepID=A0A517MCP0_9BACT|nr:hypothetical protein [Roseimaritima multifibrata]QDS92660.1 hypothetical protein FF011L_14070 [Roseimaritima multifibrata]